MSQKKKLYYIENDEKKECEKIVALPMVSGSNASTITDQELEISILQKKFLKAKIYPSELVVDSIPNTLYFENENVYELLKNNKNINLCNSPKNLLKNIENLLLDVDCYITIFYSYKVKLSIVENNMFDTVEKLREDNSKFWYMFFDNLEPLRQLMKTYTNEKYSDLLELYYRIGTLRYNCCISKYNLFQLLIEYNRVCELFHIFDGPIEIIFTDKKKIKFDDSFGKIKIEKIYDYIKEEYFNILNQYDVFT